jgi:hypothetical protein
MGNDASPYINPHAGTVTGMWVYMDLVQFAAALTRRFFLIPP